MKSPKLEQPIRVLIVDDSASGRRALTRLLEVSPGIEVVGRAADGEEGLKLALQLSPDVITLDLEMPKMDGYTFLRLLKASRPVPVIVVSSYAHQSDVFKALQLGAVDFVARPSSGEAGYVAVRAELVAKLRSVPFMRKPDGRPSQVRKQTRPLPPPPVEEEARLVLIGASTGGPPAVQKVLESLSGLPVCVVVAQHMPARFTQAFADRLDQSLSFRVSEAADGDRVAPGRVYVAPGGRQLELECRDEVLRLKVSAAAPTDAHAPSVDRLFTSAARVAPAGTFALVLTGMGNDGSRGVRALDKAGAEVWAEAESSAIVFGMPEAAIGTGVVKRTLALDELGPALARALSPR